MGVKIKAFFQSNWRRVIVAVLRQVDIIPTRRMLKQVHDAYRVSTFPLVLKLDLRCKFADLVVK